MNKRVRTYVFGRARKSSFLVGGSLLSQGLLIAISPLITRLFSPAEFAVLNIYTSFISLFAAFAVLRLDVALFLVGRSVATTLTIIGSAVSVVLAIVLGFAFYIGSVVIDVSFPTISLEALSALVCIGLVGSSVFQLVSSAAVAHGLYKESGVIRLVQTGAGCIVQVAAGFFHLGAFGLISGYIVSQSFGSMRLWKRIRHRSRNKAVVENLVGFARKYVLGRFRAFTFFSAPSSVVNRFSGSMVVVLFSMIYDFRAAGLLALAYRAANAPLLAIAKGLAQIFQKEYAKPDGFTQRQVILIFIAVLLAIGIVPIMILAIGGRSLFSFVFGIRWADAGLYAAILSPAFLLQFIASPLTQSFSLSENHKQQLAWDITRSVIISVMFMTLYILRVDVVSGLIAISATLCLIYASQILISVRVSDHLRERGAKSICSVAPPIGEPT